DDEHELLRPADGIVEDVACEHLDEEGGEHRRQEQRPHQIGEEAQARAHGLHRQTLMVLETENRTRPARPGTEGSGGYFTALMRSTMPLGQLLERSDSR